MLNQSQVALMLADATDIIDGRTAAELIRRLYELPDVEKDDADDRDPGMVFFHGKRLLSLYIRKTKNRL